MSVDEQPKNDLPSTENDAPAGRAPTLLPPLLAIGTKLGRYQVLDMLGEGGMGEVYLVDDRELKRRVALKVVKPINERTLQRFVSEARVMAQLDHPNIVPVHDVGVAAGLSYYTMRVVRGRTLADVIHSLGAGDAKTVQEYSLARRMQILVQIGQALSYAHEKRVVHRDLKPANIMLGPHGEVQVMDWGLSRVLDGDAIETSPDATRTLAGKIVGTPAYMAPEQARGQEIDTRVDVYALGVIHYELLTLERLFTGDRSTVMQKHQSAIPEAPRHRVPEKSIPRELEEICLTALKKDARDRHQTVDQMIAGVQTWLEAAADKTKRHELAEAKAMTGRAELATYRELKEEIVYLESDVDEVRDRFESWQPAEKKADLIAAEDSLRDVRRRLVKCATAVVGTLSEALGFEDDNQSAREAFADYYWDCYVAAESRFDSDGQSYFGDLVARYHDGKYARQLDGAGSLILASDPPGARILLHELVEEGFVVVEGEPRELGVTPLAAMPLAMGSYLVILQKEGFPDTRYPVHIARNREWRGTVKLFTESEIGPGFRHVPAGPFAAGGDPESPMAMPQANIFLDDYFIAEHPITAGEYLEFLNDLAGSEGLEAAKARSSRGKHDDPRTSYLEADGTGGLKLPELDDESDEWDPRHPAIAIALDDAVAYCAWRSARDGVTYVLPSEEQWEKAARGVDGRCFPWGWRFDPSLCNMRESLEERSTPVAVDEFPTDNSVYGVRGLSGNSRDWTSTVLHQGVGSRRRAWSVTRGGGWDYEMRFCRPANRLFGVPTHVIDNLGFRLAKSPR